MSYTNIFGGYNINTSFPSYMSYTFSSNLQLSWPSSYVDSPAGTGNITAQVNDLNPTVDGLTVTLANAALISVGQQVQFNNVGAHSLTINDFNGGFLATIPPTDNNQYILYLQDNTTPAGTWGITHLGAGTSSTDASAIAGFGMVALNNEINTNFPGKTIGANYQVLSSDRASILVWTGGAGTITLLNPPSNGFYIAVNNEGSGVVNITTADGSTIDGSASFALNPSSSSYFIAVEENWNTLGFGVESFFQVNVLAPINLSAVNPSLTLTSSQSSRLVQQFSGNLANNVTVYYPAAAGQWYIWNNTTGAFLVNVQLAGPTGDLVNIPQGQKLIIYSDGNSMYNAPTIATAATFTDGTVGAPGIHFSSDTSTGFYKPATPPVGVVNYSAAGTNSLSFGGAAAGYGLSIKTGLSQRYYNPANTHYVGFEPGNVTGDTLWTLPLEDATSPNQLLYSDSAENLAFTTATYPITTVANQLLYSSATNTITGLATANNRILITSAGGVPSFSQTLPATVQQNITGLGTVILGEWEATPIEVLYGGTGLATLTTAYGVVCAGTTPTGSFQNAGAGLLNQAFISNGGAALPTWQSINALKDDQVAGISNVVYSTPAVQQFHSSANKVWCEFNGSNIPVFFDSYGCASITFVAAGRWVITFANPFTTNNYSTTFGAGSSTLSHPYLCLDLFGGGVKTNSSIPIRGCNGANATTNLEKCSVQITGVQ